MRRFVVFFAAALVGVAGEAQALCFPGDVASCFANGQWGTQVCGANARFGPCSTAFQPQSGTCRPKYKILTVIYAPPGKSGGGANSSVSYGTSSTLGTTTTSSHGFKSSYSVSAQHKFGIFDTSGSYSYTNNTVDTSSVDIRKGASNTVSSPGPVVDGIDHNQDQIWLILAPIVDVTFTSPTTVEWSLDSSTTMNVQFAYVGWLKNPALLPPGVKAQFDGAGLTTADYAEILTADPFATGDVPVDTSRYAQLNTTFPYEPPFAPGGNGPTSSYTLTHTVTSSDSVAVSHDHNVSVSVNSGLSLLGQALKVSGSWTWTDSNTHAESTGATDSATVTVGNPSFGYTGPTDIAVYYDRIYRTFLFTPFTAALPALSGIVAGAAAGQPVHVVVRGVTYTGFTNHAGAFRIYGVPAGAPMEIHAGPGQVSLSRPVTTATPGQD